MQILGQVVSTLLFHTVLTVSALAFSIVTTAVADTTIRKGERILTGRILQSDETTYFLTCDGRYFVLTGNEKILKSGSSNCCSAISSSPFPDPPLPCNPTPGGPRPRPDIQAEVVMQKIANVNSLWRKMQQDNTLGITSNIAPWSKKFFEVYGLGKVSGAKALGQLSADCEEPPSGGDPCTNCAEMVQAFMANQWNWRKDFWSPRSSKGLMELEKKISIQNDFKHSVARTYIENYLWREITLNSIGLKVLSK